ncbi:MAG: hypothetical protein KME48_14005 [Candidatus Thiodiazotropha sp. (ex Ctena orbiculata)]|uniref:Uncharacterized protein n=1 Tax=Candidatus Thiodiazotropha taylori TaxID=2792791 RepID=A0A944M8A4_9GAMM|nr:hypothetical protein [Candidatus Thiodiazotropha taylori]MBT3028260.1 hypothetical protein [Candidatus Thiodiazotropha taylori]MBT3036092.1 hypothetical protein [Candidatus Thiodiazotropha taylori]MBV2137972.1 hypothetical protein [Candidatus Thiodiazotropha taylori]PVV22283.1 MAG: hypothetical protein B6D74_10145 [gamma proteobacterium symbiont of Ctena orbiculata]
MDEESENSVVEDEEVEAVFAAREAVGHLRRITRAFPHLATQPVRVALDTWDEEMFRKGELILVQKQHAKAEHDAMEQRAIEIIELSQVDDALDLINREFAKDIDYLDLIDLVGKDRYIAALTREAVELKQNSISPEQAAELWNSLGKPTLGGERWNATGVTVLMKG